MVFSSIIFILFFLPVFLLTYYFSGKKFKNLTFLIFSVLFYAWGAPWFVAILIGSTLLNFYIVRTMYYSQVRNRRRLLAGLSVFINLGLLAYFKYANFFIENVNTILHAFGSENVHWTKVALPIGISFFTFQSLTYTIDIYRRIHPPLRNPLNYVLYIIMFPQLIAGPIVRFETIADQLTDRQETNEDRLTGFYRFVIGLAKKVLIADVLGAEVNNVMGMNWANLDATTAWTGILAYAFQIYFDFAGYSDMAIGLGRMIGFSFPENFDNPYTARSITEFWRRWHMTFTTFMRIYLYYPLGGNRVRTKWRLYFNLMFVFLVSGLWHGASWNFVIWGLIHGFFLIIERIFLLKLLDRTGRFIGVVYTFFVVVLAWVPFRVDSLNHTLIYYSHLFSTNFTPLYWGLNAKVYIMILIAMIISLITLFKLGRTMQDQLYKTSLSVKEHTVHFSVTLVVFLLIIASLAGSGFSPFIYFRF